MVWAKLLSDALQRPCDLLARYGGEEFVVILGETDFALNEAKTSGRNCAIAAVDGSHNNSLSLFNT